jgi:hypothetical protein
VLKDRFRDIMRELRVESKEKARADGKVIEPDKENFDITSNYPPEAVPIEKWKRLCKVRMLIHYCFFLSLLFFIY